MVRLNSMYLRPTLNYVCLANGSPINKVMENKLVCYKIKGFY